MHACGVGQKRLWSKCTGVGAACLEGALDGSLLGLAVGEVVPCGDYGLLASCCRGCWSAEEPGG